MKSKNLILFLFCSLILTACCDRPDDYAAELATLERKISALHAGINKDNAIKQAYYFYLKSSLTGDYADFKTTETAIEAALKKFGSANDLLYFKANLEFKLHRLEQAKSAMAMLPQLAQSTDIRILNADIALQQGHYAEALGGYEQILEQDPSWDKLARMAYYRLKTGDPEQADTLYQQAQDKISAKEMRSYAWLELQRGLIDLEYSRHTAALKHYEHADRAYSGYWLIEEHIAEVLMLLGREKEAIRLYKKIIAKNPNPEFIIALANILADSDRKSADALYRRADELYAQRTALYPEAVMGHFLEFLLEKNAADPRLLEYALQNHRLRPNAEAKLLLAKTYIKLGDQTNAKTVLEDILQTPWRTPEIIALIEEFGISAKSG